MVVPSDRKSYEGINRKKRYTWITPFFKVLEVIVFHSTEKQLFMYAGLMSRHIIYFLVNITLPPIQDE